MRSSTTKTLLSSLIVMHNAYLELSYNWNGSSELLMYHKAKNSHHSSTAVVQLNTTLLELGLLVKGVPTEVKSSITEVSYEFTLSGYILHYSKLKSSYESYNLEKSSLWDGSYSSPSIWDGVEGGTCGVDVSWKVDSVTGNDLSKESKLTDTSVLDLYITKTVETLLVSIVEESKRIEEAKWWLYSKLRLEGVEGTGGLGYLGRSKGGG
jgi:hypothetical protein